MNRHETEFVRRKRYYSTQYRYAKQARDIAIGAFRERIRSGNPTLHKELETMGILVEKYREMLNPTTSGDVKDKVKMVLDGFELLENGERRVPLSMLPNPNDKLSSY